MKDLSFRRLSAEQFEQGEMIVSLEIRSAFTDYLSTNNIQGGNRIVVPCR
jgi:hypothetical protein